jgi:acyl-CoA synthetase (NDP forming)
VGDDHGGMMQKKFDPKSLDAKNLEHFLSPRSVAIIGASPEPHRIRGALLRLLRKNDFPGAIYPINPSYGEIDGLRCYPTIAAVGAPVDLALVAIPAAAVLSALEECAAAGVGNAIIISSGFAEDGVAPSDLQDRIVALARRTGMRICGPNAEGFHNEVDRVTATFSPATDPDATMARPALPHRIGIVAQSGGMGFALYNRGRAIGLAFSAVVTTGNEADLTAADFIAHLVGREDTAAILLFLETIRDPALFAAATTAARDAGKPVVVVKVGRSAAGKAAASSHTASMAGWDVAYDAMFRRCGVVVAHDIDEASVFIAALLSNPPARGPRVAVVTVSGGAGALAADMISAAGLQMPELSAQTQAEIRSFIPSYGATRNPVDLTAGGAQGGGLLRTIELLSRDEAVDQIAVAVSLSNATRVSFDHGGLQALLQERRKPILFYSYTLPSPLGQNSLVEAGAPIFPSMDMLAAAARMLAARGEKPVPAAAPLLLSDHVRARLEAAAGPLAEHAAKAVLAAVGIAMPAGGLVRDEAELDATAASLGYPLAVKIQSADILHKTEAQGVRLGIGDRAALAQAYRSVVEAAKNHNPAAHIDGVLVEKMAARGVEMIVGILRDPTFGPVVMVGAGGVTTELFRDTAYRLAPVDEIEATAMLRELRSAPLLDGFRGAPKADVPALARLISLASRFADAGRERIAELELNPVIVHAAGEGCSVADALLVLAPQGEEAKA